MEKFLYICLKTSISRGYYLFFSETNFANIRIFANIWHFHEKNLFIYNILLPYV